MANTGCNIEKCTDSRRDADRHKRVGGGERGLSKADQQNRFSVHLHVKWPGCDTAREEPAGENEERFPGQCYVIADHRLFASSSS